MTDVVPADVTSFEDLRKALAARRKQLGMSQLVADEVSGLQGGYVAKLEVGIRRPGDMSLQVWLQTLGVKLQLVQPSRTQRKSRVSSTSCSLAEEDYFKRRLEKATAAARLLPKAAKIERARKAARARWRNERRRRARRASAERKRANDSEPSSLS